MPWLSDMRFRQLPKIAISGRERLFACAWYPINFLHKHSIKEFEVQWTAANALSASSTIRDPVARLPIEISSEISSLLRNRGLERISKYLGVCLLFDIQVLQLVSHHPDARCATTSTLACLSSYPKPRALRPQCSF
jgi:hypothetical protein